MQEIKKGDRLVVKPDLKEGSALSTFVNDEMVRLRGKVVTVTNIYGSSIHLKECSYNWTREMFLPGHAKKHKRKKLNINK